MLPVILTGVPGEEPGECSSGPSCLFSPEQEEFLEGSSFAVKDPVVPKGESKSLLNVNGQSNDCHFPVMTTDGIVEHLPWGRHCPSASCLVSHLSLTVTL